MIWIARIIVWQIAPYATSIRTTVALNLNEVSSLDFELSATNNASSIESSWLEGKAHINVKHSVSPQMPELLSWRIPEERLFRQSVSQ